MNAALADEPLREQRPLQRPVPTEQPATDGRAGRFVVDPATVAEVRERFTARLDLDRTPREVLAGVVDELLPLDPAAHRAAVVAVLAADLIGLGPIEALLADDAVTDVLITGDGTVWVDASGALGPTGLRLSGTEVGRLVERAFRHTGISVDRSHPIADARLPGGARISVVLPSLAPDGPQVAIRRFSLRPLDLAAFASPGVVECLVDVVRRRANVVIYGATGSGKTSLVGALSRHVDPGERVVTIEEAAELQLGLPHTVRLEARPDNGDGAGGASIRSLVRAALRLRPDRIVVGEVRGSEALDMVWAMSSGHRGSLSTIHASSAADALARLETFILLAEADLPITAIRSQVAAAIDVLVGVRRVGSSRTVSAIHEVVRGPDGVRLGRIDSTVADAPQRLLRNDSIGAP